MGDDVRRYPRPNWDTGRTPGRWDDHVRGPHHKRDQFFPGPGSWNDPPPLKRPRAYEGGGPGSRPPPHQPAWGQRERGPPFPRAENGRLRHGRSSSPPGRRPGHRPSPSRSVGRNDADFWRPRARSPILEPRSRPPYVDKCDGPPKRPPTSTVSSDKKHMPAKPQQQDDEDVMFSLEAGELASLDATKAKYKKKNLEEEGGGSKYLVPEVSKSPRPAAVVPASSPPAITADHILASIDAADAELTAAGTELAELQLEVVRLSTIEPRFRKALEKAQEVPAPIGPEPPAYALENEDEMMSSSEESEGRLVEVGVEPPPKRRRGRPPKQRRGGASNRCSARLDDENANGINGNSKDNHVDVAFDDVDNGDLPSDPMLPSARRGLFARLGSHLMGQRAKDTCARVLEQSKMAAAAAHDQFTALGPSDGPSVAPTNRDMAETAPPGIARVLRREFVAMLWAHVDAAIEYRERYEVWRKKELRRIAAAAQQNATSGFGRPLSGRGASMSLELPSSPSLGRVSSRGRADIVRSDLEERQAIATLNAVDAIKRMVELPSMRLVSQRAARWTTAYIDRNRLVQDPMGDAAQRKLVRPWSAEERALFADKFLVHHKDFQRIAQHLPDRTVPEVVRHYYAIQRDDSFAHTRRKYQLRKRRDKAEENAAAARQAGFGMSITTALPPAAGGAGMGSFGARLLQPEGSLLPGAFIAGEKSERSSGRGGFNRTWSRSSVQADADSTDGAAVSDAAGQLTLHGTKGSRSRGTGRDRKGASFSKEGVRGRTRVGPSSFFSTLMVVSNLEPVNPEPPVPTARATRTAPAKAKDAYVSLLDHLQELAMQERRYAKVIEDVEPEEEDAGAASEVHEEDVEEEDNDSADFDPFHGKTVANGPRCRGRGRLPHASTDAKFVEAIKLHGRDWVAVAAHVGNRTPGAARLYWSRHAERLGLVTPGEESEEAMSGDCHTSERPAGSTAEMDAKPTGGGRQRGKPSFWTAEEKQAMMAAYSTHGRDWNRLQEAVPTKTMTQIRNYYQNYRTKVFDPIVLPPGVAGRSRRTRQKASPAPSSQRANGNHGAAIAEGVGQQHQRQYALLLQVLAQQRAALANMAGAPTSPSADQMFKFMAMMQSTSMAMHMNTALQLQQAAQLLPTMPMAVPPSSADGGQSILTPQAPTNEEKDVEDDDGDANMQDVTD